MKVTISELKKYIPQLDWPIEKIVDRMSMIGHETEVIDDDSLEVKVTTNRQDCKDIKYLAFDFAALCEDLGDPSNIVQITPGKKIEVNTERINKILGSNINTETFNKLSRLGFLVNEQSVTAPNFRVDVSEAADVAEEIFRFIGVNGIKVEQLDKQSVVKSQRFELLNRIRFALASVGGTETRTISFSDRGDVELRNPFSKELSYLQPDLIDGLLETLAKNPFSRRNIFYEIADVYTPEESTHLGIVISGYKKPDELIAKLSKAVGKNLSFNSVDQNQLDKFSVKQPNVQIAEVAVDLINPELIEKFEAKLPIFKAISQFPPLVRDVNITSFDNVGMDNYLEKIHNEFPELLLVEQVDSYVGPSTGKVTDTYRFIFQKHSDSFTSDEISDIDQKLNQCFFDKA